MLCEIFQVHNGIKLFRQKVKLSFHTSSYSESDSFRVALSQTHRLLICTCALRCYNFPFQSGISIEKSRISRCFTPGKPGALLFAHVWFQLIVIKETFAHVQLQLSVTGLEIKVIFAHVQLQLPVTGLEIKVIFAHVQ